MIKRCWLLAVFLASCGTVDFAKVDPKDLGPQPSAATMIAAAESRLQDTLIDPESRRLRWFDREPQQAALYTGFLRSGWVYGWGMRFGMNSKNRLGGYVGETLYFILRTEDTTYVGAVPPDNHFQVRPAGAEATPNK